MAADSGEKDAPGAPASAPSAVRPPWSSVSIVVPVYNEADNVEPLAAELDALRPALPGLEVVFVDDGSTDATWARLDACRARYDGFRPIRRGRNRGQSAAMLAGLRQAKGDVLVVLDGDRQNDPRDIPRLVAALEGCDAVCGYRARRKDSCSRRLASRLGNRVRNWVTHDGVRDTGCSLKAFRRECAADLPPFNGMHRFMPAYFKLNGRIVVELPVSHRERTRGVSKYTNLGRLPRTAFDLLGFVWYRKRYLAGL